MKKVLWLILVGAMFNGTLVNGKSVAIREIVFNEFMTFYISNIDVSTGAQDVHLFTYELYEPAGTYPIWAQVEFEILINSIPLGLTYNSPFLRVVTRPFQLRGPVQIRNTDLDTNTDQIYYSSGPYAGEAVSFIIDESTTIFDDPEYNIDDLQSLIIQSGRLPDGIYRFNLIINAWDGNPDEDGVRIDGDEIDKTIVSAHPISLELISPGGPFAEIQNQTIMTTYPFFQWQSDPCPICSYRIRVARFIPDEHSAAEDAIEDQTVLPIEQALGWHPEKDMDGKFLPTTSLQYPQSGAVDLEPGNIYVWQVQKIIPTTVGDETINSVIYAFMVQEQQAGYDPIKETVRTVLGDERFEQLYGVGGELMGFIGDEEGISISGSINVGGVELEAGNIDVNALLQIARLIEQGEISVVESEVQ